jgi:hypothetical protein
MLSQYIASLLLRQDQPSPRPWVKATWVLALGLSGEEILAYQDRRRRLVSFQGVRSSHRLLGDPFRPQDDQALPPFCHIEKGLGVEERGLPEVIITDNGPEFRSHAFDSWAYGRGIKLEFIQPGKPVQNAFIESLNATFRNECRNLHWFRSLGDAKRRIESWRVQYNRVRPHSSLGGLTPEEFGFAPPEEQERITTTSPVVRE